MSDGSGVTITTREIYESVNNLTKEVNSLGSRFDKLESKISDQSQLSYEAKERSYKALNLATQANNNAIEASKDAESALNKFDQLEKRRYEDKIAENQRQKDTRTKLYITIASSLIPWVITVVLGIIYIAKNNGF